ncbi:MAG TPA: phosphoribosylanthranilate isomerase [Vicinamibacterales bacterium]|nr:phosphoribosylanthranilate isomerase [Vicinamibacterales bacterium]
MLVKICGVTRAADALAAVEAGANAIGFVFWPESPRFIDPFRARAIAARLPPFVTPVGLFVNQPAAYIKGVASLVRLGAVQLHGDETPSFAASIAAPVIKAVPIGAADAWPLETTLLLDAHDPIKRGGTGRTIDWSAAAAIARRRRVLLAGGLTPENIAEAIARVRPFGVDVSSGVEQAPGIKDHQRIRALFEAIHGTSDVTARS